MIGWQQPIAWWGLAWLALPIAIHLLQRRRAVRMRFPTTQFISVAQSTSVSRRALTDAALLAVRLLIVAAAVAAAARPIVVTGARARVWNGRVVRAVVVDISDSMRRPRGSTVAADLAAGHTRSETAGSFWSITIERADLAQAIEEAVARLDTAPPARREIVVVSDFAADSAFAAAIARVPTSIGLRFIAVGEGERERRFDGLRLFGDVVQRQRVLLTPSATVIESLRADGVPAGLRFVNASAEEVAALTRIVAGAGAPAPPADRPIAISFSAQPVSAGPIDAGWTLSAAAGILGDADVKAALTRLDAVTVREDGRELFVAVSEPAGSLLAAAVVRAALVAQHGAVSFPEEEVRQLPTAELSRWTRAPGDVPPDVWRHSDGLDARWFWVVAMVLLLVEQGLRNRPKTSASAEAARAA